MTPPDAELQAGLADAVAALQRGDAVAARARLEAASVRWPDDADLRHLLGLCALHQGDAATAVAQLRLAVAGAPEVAEFRFNLALACRRSGDPAAAQRELDAIVARRADFAPALELRAELALEARAPAQAAAALRQLARLRPGDADVQLRLGEAALAADDLGAAIDAFRRATALAPAFARAWNNLGVALGQGGEIGAALAAFGRAIALDGDNPRLLGNYAKALADAGRVDEALELLGRALARAPGDPLLLSNRLMTALYSDRPSPPQIADAHRAFEKAIGAAPRPLPRRPAGGRPLRVAYLSPDLRNHPVAYFLEGLLAAHDRRVVTPILYACGPREDAWTRRLFALADQAAVVAGLDDGALARRVAEDRVDILVDLAGHTAYNRMPALASRLAPVQVSYLGYPFSTGVSAIDYRLTDAIADPPGSEDLAAETLLRLARSYYAYTPPADVPDVAPLPMLARGAPTFGVCSNLSKVSPTTLDLWARLLIEIPHARLVWRAKAFEDAATATAMRQALGGRGVAAGRVDCLPWEGDQARWAVFAQIDLALDTYPYNQATSTCEALWMGVPTLTLAGPCHQARMGASILAAAKLPEFIAESRDEWVAAARRALADPPALAALRASLRDRLRATPLLDVAGLAREIEACYRNIGA